MWGLHLGVLTASTIYSPNYSQLHVPSIHLVMFTCISTCLKTFFIYTALELLAFCAMMWCLWFTFPLARDRDIKGISGLNMKPHSINVTHQRVSVHFSGKRKLNQKGLHPRHGDWWRPGSVDDAHREFPLGKHQITADVARPSRGTRHLSSGTEPCGAQMEQRVTFV